MIYKELSLSKSFCYSYRNNKVITNLVSKTTIDFPMSSIVALATNFKCRTKNVFHEYLFLN